MPGKRSKSSDWVRLRVAIRTAGGRGRHGYPRAVRDEVVAYVRGARRDGLSWTACAEQLGLNAKTLRAWCTADERPAFVPVAVVDRHEVLAHEERTGRLVLVLSSGAELRGLTLEDAIALVRGLS